MHIAQKRLLGRWLWYRLVKCICMWYFGSWASSPGSYPYHIPAYLLHCRVSTWRIVWLTTYACGTEVSLFVLLFPSLKGFCRRAFSFHVRVICIVAHWLYVTCSRVLDCETQLMETVSLYCLLWEYCMRCNSGYSLRARCLSLKIILSATRHFTGWVWRFTCRLGTIPKFVVCYLVYWISRYTLVEVAVITSLCREHAARDRGFHQLNLLVEDDVFYAVASRFIAYCLQCLVVCQRYLQKAVHAVIPR